MSTQLLLACLFTFIIHLVSTLSLTVRVVGLRTRRFALSYALFAAMALASRTVNTLQGPLLAGQVEANLRAHRTDDASDFRWVILTATLATLAGMLAFPSFQRLLAKGVEGYYQRRSFGRLMLWALAPRRLRQIPHHLKWPATANVGHLRGRFNVSLWVLFLNALANAVLTVGVLATLYAAYLRPELRATSASLSGVVNGLAVVIMTIVIDPQMALLTDEVLAGTHSEGYYRRYIVLILVARLVGTLLAQALLVPFAYGVVWVAEGLGR
jgi:small-conductance mechanosensitive channel